MCREGEVANARIGILSKEFYAVIAFLLVQTGTIAWWAATLTAEVKDLKEEKTKYVTQTQLGNVVDMVKDCRRSHDRVDNKLDDVIESLARIEGRHEAEKHNGN